MDAFLPALKTIICLLVLVTALALVGIRISRKFTPNLSVPEFYPLFGWAIAIILMLPGMLASGRALLGTTVFLLSGMLLSGGALLGMAVFLLFATFYLFSRKIPVRDALSYGFVFCFVLALPLLYGVSLYQPREWDDFSHWLPNAYYLFSHGEFPHTGGLPTHSWWPGYPYGFSLLIAALSWINGTFTESAGPLLNVGLLFLFAAFLARQLSAADASWRTKLKISALVLVVLTLCNPGFNEFITLSSYGDHASAILLGFLFFCAVQAATNEEKRRDYLNTFAIIAIPFLQLKQANLFTLLILAASVWIAVPKRGKLFLSLGAALLPALIGYGIWEVYKYVALPHAAFDVRATTWLWHLLPDLFAAMSEVVLSKSGYFALLFGLLGWGLWDAFKKKSARDALLSSFTLLLCGYFGFLVLAYMGSTFSEREVTSAATFFRYMSHLQYAALLIIILKAGEALQRSPQKGAAFLKSAGWTSVVLIPIAGIALVSLDLLPKPSVEARAARKFAEEISAALPHEAKIAVLQPESEAAEVSIINYSLARANEAIQWLIPTYHHPEVVARIDRFAPDLSLPTLQAFAQKYDVVMLAPNDKLAWGAVDQPVEGRWGAFQYDTQQKIWTRLSPRHNLIEPKAYE
jgi:hypothetical protein